MMKVFKAKVCPSVNCEGHLDAVWRVLKEGAARSIKTRYVLRCLRKNDVIPCCKRVQIWSSCAIFCQYMVCSLFQATLILLRARSSSIIWSWHERFIENWTARRKYWRRQTGYEKLKKVTTDMTVMLMKTQMCHSYTTVINLRRVLPIKEIL